MNKPTFLVIGAAKCGTTTVCDLVGDHPDVYMTTPKEPHYFSRLTKYHELRPWYSSLFEDAGAYEAAGEGSTSYSHPHRIDFVVPRIRETLPQCRIIYMVRHPIRRLESDWKMRLREGRASESIYEAADRHASLITFGLYWKHLQKYREYFPDEQLLVVFLEDLADHPGRVLRKILRHIEVDPSLGPDDPDRQRNAATQYREKGTLAATMRRLPGYERLRRNVPDRIVRLTKYILTDQFDPSPEWDEDALSIVSDFFSEDSRNLLDYCGKPPDFWKLGDQ